MCQHFTIVKGPWNSVRFAYGPEVGISFKLVDFPFHTSDCFNSIGARLCNDLLSMSDLWRWRLFRTKSGVVESKQSQKHGKDRVRRESLLVSCTKGDAFLSRCRPIRLFCLEIDGKFICLYWFEYDFRSPAVNISGDHFSIYFFELILCRNGSQVSFHRR